MREILDVGFGDDDGSATPAVVEALAAYAADPCDGYRTALAALQVSRLLVPVVAVLGEVEYDEQGLARDKSSDMAAVLMRGKDGRTALLAFTCLETMQRWNPEARPVPVSTPAAAQAAVHDGAAALVVDVAGPVLFVVEEQDLRALAEGFTLVDTGEGAAWAKVSGGASDRAGDRASDGVSG